MTNNQSYGKTAIVLHWFTALLIVLVIPLAWIMGALERGPLSFTLFNWHKSIGFSILLLTALRLVSRLISGVPPAPANTPAVINKISGLIHLALYALLFAIPLVGWAMVSAAGHPLVYLGLWQLPDFVAKDHALHETLANVHETLAYVLLALVALHAAAALKHHFIQRDDVLTRMMPSLRKR
jgi:cytochrome b561